MSLLYVIRHAQVEIDPAKPPGEWRLSTEGWAAASQLAERVSWENVSRIYHSPERKAEETARAIAGPRGLTLCVAADLRELAADTGYLARDVFVERVGAYLEGADDPAFEPFDTACRRIRSCVEHIVAEAAGRPVAIVSHGRILTALYSWLSGRRLTRHEWQSIALPDLSVVCTKTWTVQSGFLAKRLEGFDLLQVEE